MGKSMWKYRGCIIEGNPTNGYWWWPVEGDPADRVKATSIEDCKSQILLHAATAPARGAGPQGEG